MAIKDWISNSTRSFKYMALSSAKNLFPTIDKTYETVSTINTDIKDMGFDAKVLNEKGMKFWEKTGKPFLSNLKDDLKTGNLYNKERADKAMGMDGFDLDDSAFENLDDLDFGDSTVDDADDEEKSVNNNFNIDNKKILINNQSSVNENIMEKMTNANIRGSSINFDNSMKRSTSYQLIAMNRLSSNLSVINTSIQELYNSMSSLLEKFHEASYNFYSGNLGLLGEIANSLKSSNRYSELYYKSIGINPDKDSNDNRSVFEKIFAYGFDIGEYGKLLKDNFMELEFLKSTFEMAESSGMINNIVDQPVQTLFNVMVNKLIKPLSKSINRINDALSNLPVSLMNKLTIWSNNMDDALIPSIKRFIGSRFGVQSNKDTGMGLSINTEAVKFDNRTRHAIINVIPMYLAKILASITKDSEKLYDYSTGKLVDKNDLKEDIERKKNKLYNEIGSKDYMTNESEGETPQAFLINKLIKNQGIDASDKTAYDLMKDDVSKYLGALAKKGFIDESGSIGSGIKLDPSLQLNSNLNHEDFIKLMSDSLESTRGKAEGRILQSLVKSIYQTNDELDKILKFAARDNKMDLYGKEAISMAFADSSIKVRKTPEEIKKEKEKKLEESRKNKQKSKMEKRYGSSINTYDMFERDELKNQVDFNNMNSINKSIFRYGRKVSNFIEGSISILLFGENSLNEPLMKRFKKLFSTNTIAPSGILGTLTTSFHKDLIDPLKKKLIGDSKDDDLNLIESIKYRFNESIMTPLKQFILGKNTSKLLAERNTLLGSIKQRFDKSILLPFKELLFGSKNLAKKKSLMEALLFKFDRSIIIPLKQFILGDDKSLIGSKTLLQSIWFRLNKSVLTPLKQFVLGKKDSFVKGSKSIIDNIRKTLTDKILKPTLKVLLGSEYIDEEGNVKRNNDSIFNKMALVIKEKLLGKDNKSDAKNKTIKESIMFRIESSIINPLKNFLFKGSDVKDIKEKSLLDGLKYKFQNSIIEPTKRLLFKGLDLDGKDMKELSIFQGLKYRLNTSIIDPAIKLIFGENASPDSIKKHIKKSLPNAFIGSGVGLLGSMFLPGGPLVGAISGATFALLKDTSFFKTNITEPFIAKTKFVLNELRDFFKDKVFKPLSLAVQPFMTEFKNQFTNLKNVSKEALISIGSLISDSFQKEFGKSLVDILKEHILDPMKKVLNTITNSVLSIFKTVVGLPVKLISSIAKNLSEKHKGLSNNSDKTNSLNEDGSKKSWTERFKEDLAKKKAAREELAKLKKNEEIAKQSEATNIKSTADSSKKLVTNTERMIRYLKDLVDLGHEKIKKVTKKNKTNKDNLNESKITDFGVPIQLVHADIIEPVKPEEKMAKKIKIESLSDNIRTGKVEEHTTEKVTKSNKVENSSNNKGVISSSYNMKNNSILGLLVSIDKTTKNTNRYVMGIYNILRKKRKPGIFDRLGKFSFKDLFTNPLNFFKGLFGELVSKTGSIFKKITMGLSDILTSIFGIPKQIIEFSSKLLGKMVKGIGHIIKNMDKIIKEAAKATVAIIESLAEIGKAIIDQTTKLLVVIGKGVGKVIDGMGKLFGGVFKTASDFISKLKIPTFGFGVTNC